MKTFMIGLLLAFVFLNCKAEGEENECDFKDKIPALKRIKSDADDQESCKSSCDNEPKCKLWQFLKKRCFLTVIVPKDKKRIDYGLNHCKETSENPSFCQTADGLFKFEQENKTPQFPDECKQGCMDNPNCIYWVFNQKKNHCRYYTLTVNNRRMTSFGVKCPEILTTTVSPTIPTTILPNPIIKLEGGENANEGYVMVKIPDEEEYLHIVAYSYDPYSNERNINVACRMLGYPHGGTLITDNRWEISNNRSFVHQFRCNEVYYDMSDIGPESSLFDCYWTIDATTWMLTEEVLAVICHENEPKFELIGGDASSGQVMLEYNFTMIPVCGDSFYDLNRWSSYDAKVACRMLGYSSAYPVLNGLFSDPMETSQDGYGYITCKGTENSLYECDHWRDYNGWYYGWNYECTPAGVLCGVDKRKERVELVENESPDSNLENGGFLKFYDYISDSMIDVCFQTYNYIFSEGRPLAHVACRQLGYTTGVGMARNETLDIDVCATFSCKGSEKSLYDCDFYLEYNTTRLSYAEIAEIECYNHEF